MKKLLSGLMASLLAVLAGAATPTPPLTAPVLDADTLADIARHEQIAAAHLQAARCLRAGQAHDACEGALQQACKGIAIGRFCGMKH